MFDTVCALSSPPGKGGVALFRISGAEAACIADRVFFPKNGRPLSALPPRTAVFGEILWEGSLIDTGVAVLFRGPASFTGEDTVEITTHGSVAVQKALLTALYGAGAVPAGPGEFTRRAFVNGKLSLPEAEAVGLLIDADTESRRQLAVSALSGKIREKTAGIADGLTFVLSALYAAIDYPDEDVGDEGERQILSAVETALRETKALLSTYKRGAAIAGGVATVLVGAPNSGKSSLYNALLREEAAIVTDVPGTTRDVLSASAEVGGVTLRLFDTAGLRDTEDRVEMLGVARTKERMEQAELLLFLADASRPLEQEDRDALSALPAGVPVIAVLNKWDLSPALTEADLSLLTAASAEVVRLSAKTGEGMDALAEAVSRTVGDGNLSPLSDAVIWDARQAAALSRAADCLTEARDGLRAGDPPDALCTLCESAVSELMFLDGRAVDEAIIEGIFARFCVGK